MNESARYTFGTSPAAAERLRSIGDFFNPIADMHIRRFVKTRAEVAIDLGCGPGFTTAMLAGATRCRDTYGLDRSGEFLYHLVLETADSTLSRGMRHLNGGYTQRFNRRHGRVGHMVQGRYQAILVQKDVYLLALSRYVVFNPVRARMVDHPVDWPWSSYRATIGRAQAPSWLATDWMLSQCGSERAQAIRASSHFVRDGADKPGPWADVRHQVFLGEESFVARFQDRKPPEELRDIPSAQRQPLDKPLSSRPWPAY